MKKIFHFIIMILCLQVNAQEKPQAITITGTGIIDTLRPVENSMIDTKKLNKKLISQEVSLTQPLDVLVEMNGVLTVKVWNENKVKIESSVWIEGNNELTDEKWLEKINISNKRFGNTVKVDIGQAEKFTNGFSSSGRTFTLDRTRNTTETVYSGNGTFLGSLYGNREITLYVPSTSKVEIENKYGLLAVANNIRNISIVNTNGEVNAQDIDQLELRSSAGRFTAGIIKNGDINISHGRLYLAELTKGVLNTAYNTIEIERVGDVKLNSASDDMDISESKSISGIKNYGSLQINVSGRLDVEGVNSRIKLRNIAPAADLIRIFDMNADLRIPIHESKNYAIDVKGSFINLYSSYSDKTVTDTLSANEAAEIKAKRDTLLELAKKLSGRTITLTGITTTRPERPTDMYVDGKPVWSAKDGQVAPGTAITLNENEIKLIGAINYRDSIIRSKAAINAKDSLIKPNSAIKLTDSRIKTGTPVNLKDSQIKPATTIKLTQSQVLQSSTITIKDSFTTIKSFKYTIKTGDAAVQTKFDITCTNCTVDFK